MPIEWRVKDVAERRGIMTISQLASTVGVAYDTAADLWHGRARRIDLGTLDRFCESLACEPADLLIRLSSSINPNDNH